MNPASRLLVFSDCRLTSVFSRSSTQLKAMSGTLVGQRGPGLATLRSVKSGGEGGGGRGGSFQNFTKDLGGCSASWRAVAIFFIVVTIAMASTLAFVLGEPAQPPPCREFSSQDISFQPPAWCLRSPPTPRSPRPAPWWTPTPATTMSSLVVNWTSLVSNRVQVHIIS